MSLRSWSGTTEWKNLGQARPGQAVWRASVIHRVKWTTYVAVDKVSIISKELQSDIDNVLIMWGLGCSSVVEHLPDV